MNARQVRQRRASFYPPCSAIENLPSEDRNKGSINNLRHDSANSSIPIAVSPTAPEPTPAITEPEVTATAPKPGQSQLKVSQAIFGPKGPTDAALGAPRCQFADPIRIGVPSSGESHQQDELSPVNKVEPERGTSHQQSAHRCQFSFSDGRQCRMPRAESHDSLCLHHASTEEEALGPLGMRELESLPAEFTTATDVNRALSQVFRLLAQGRISRRDAVAFGYLGQLMLQSVPGVRAEFVAAFGYRAWQENLQNKVNGNQGPLPQPEISAAPAATPAVQSNLPQSAAAPTPAAPASPDYESLLSRSLDAFDGKYDTTPEGRRELHRLMFDLEELAPTALPRGSIEARLSACLHKIREGQSKAAGPHGAEPAPSFRNFQQGPHFVAQNLTRTK